jgi:hypothetical protein
VEYNGSLSTPLTPARGGLTSSILFGRHDVRELGSGEFCYIQLGKRDGIQPGDHFVVYRPNPSFNQRDMSVGGSGADTTYAPIRHSIFPDEMDSKLKKRTIPSKVLGDIVIVETGERISTGRIVNSLTEIHPGDLVVKR